jgi:hypothetical protein
MKFDDDFNHFLWKLWNSKLHHCNISTSFNYMITHSHFASGDLFNAVGYVSPVVLAWIMCQTPWVLLQVMDFLHWHGRPEDMRDGVLQTWISTCSHSTPIAQLFWHTHRAQRALCHRNSANVPPRSVLWLAIVSWIIQVLCLYTLKNHFCMDQFDKDDRYLSTGNYIWNIEGRNTEVSEKCIPRVLGTCCVYV